MHHHSNRGICEPLIFSQLLPLPPPLSTSAHVLLRPIILGFSRHIMLAFSTHSASHQRRPRSELPPRLICILPVYPGFCDSSKILGLFREAVLAFRPRERAFTFPSKRNGSCRCFLAAPAISFIAQTCLVILPASKRDRFSLSVSPLLGVSKVHGFRNSSCWRQCKQLGVVGPRKMGVYS